MASTQFEFRADLDTEGFEMTPQEIASVETEIDHLKPLVKDFPTQILHVNLAYHANTRSYEVQLPLVLPGQTFATANSSDSWHASLEKCVGKLIRRVEHYKAVMSGEPQHGHLVSGTEHELKPDQQIDGNQVNQAVESDDY